MKVKKEKEYKIYRSIGILYGKKSLGKVKRDFICFNLQSNKGCEDLFDFLHMVKNHIYEIYSLTYQLEKED